MTSVCTALKVQTNVIKKAAKNRQYNRGNFVMSSIDALASYVYEFSVYDWLALCALAVVAVNMIRRRLFRAAEPEPEPQLPPMSKRDFRPSELRGYDGSGTDGRLLLGCMGKVYDVTIAKRNYGPGGPYNTLTGRDASRALATMDIAMAINDEYDACDDLGAGDAEALRDWAQSFDMRYPIVGRVLRPEEEPTDYSKEGEGDKKTD